MPTTFIQSVLLIVTLLLAQLASAAQVSDLQTALTTARENLVAMLDSKDKAAQDEAKKKIEKATTDLDTALAAILADKATPADTVTKLKGFETTWVEFKKTRDTEIIPAIVAGKTEDAKALAKGVQAERYKKLKDTLDGLMPKKEEGGDRNPAR